MPNQNRALGVRVGQVEYPHRLEHHDGAGAVVGSAGRGIPGIHMGREHHVLVRLLGTTQLGDDVVNRSFAK